ncbi:MAG: DUF3667 domain-containing protein [Flavobacteriales bacterium]
MNTCENCSYNYNEKEKYCSNCGQKIGEKFSLKLMFSHTIANYFSLDSSLKRSIIPLLFKPGFLAQEFVSGKRTKYIHPAKLYFFISFVFFITLSFSFEKQIQSISSQFDSSKFNSTSASDTISDSDSSVFQLDFSGNQPATESEGEDAEKITINLSPNSSIMSNIAEKIIGFDKASFSLFLNNFVNNLPFSLFFSVPIFAIFLWIIYGKKRGNFAEHFTFSLYYFTFTFISILLAIGLYQLIPEISIIVFFVLLINWIFLANSMRRFYNTSTRKSYFISSLQGVLFLFMLMPLSVFLVFLYPLLVH